MIYGCFFVLGLAVGLLLMSAMADGAFRRMRDDRDSWREQHQAMQIRYYDQIRRSNHAVLRGPDGRFTSH